LVRKLRFEMAVPDERISVRRGYVGSVNISRPAWLFDTGNGSFHVIPAVPDMTPPNDPAALKAAFAAVFIFPDAVITLPPFSAITENGSQGVEGAVVNTPSAPFARSGPSW
jgi:hypothetical protein